MTITENDMQKWEYCLLSQHEFQKFVIYWPDETKEEVEGNLINACRMLGNFGWEAVNVFSRRISISHRRRRVQVLFKRPIEGNEQTPT
jgi:hypothetical protein